MLLKTAFGGNLRFQLSSVEPKLMTQGRPRRTLLFTSSQKPGNLRACLIGKLSDQACRMAVNAYKRRRFLQRSSERLRL